MCFSSLEPLCWHSLTHSLSLTAMSFKQFTSSYLPTKTSYHSFLVHATATPPPSTPLFTQPSCPFSTPDVKSAAVACGVANTLGNKGMSCCAVGSHTDIHWAGCALTSIHPTNHPGGVAIRLKIMKSSFLFVSCHLEAHQNNVKHRNANFHRIEGNLKFDGDSDGTKSCSQCDYCVQATMC